MIHDYEKQVEIWVNEARKKYVAAWREWARTPLPWRTNPPNMQQMIAQYLVTRACIKGHFFVLCDKPNEHGADCSKYCLDCGRERDDSIQMQTTSQVQR